MKLFLDTADIEEIRTVNSWGVLDGVTTNPTLFGKVKGMTYDEVLKLICEITPGPVSAEVVADDVEGMLKEGRHNLRGERISVDTIALVGEENIAAAVRAVADLPRARLLVLAGSIMGGDISVAADELRAVGIPIIALNMVGSITEHVDLVVSDPVQAGTMAVMAVADTATFDLARQRGRRY